MPMHPHVKGGRTSGSAWQSRAQPGSTARSGRPAREGCSHTPRVVSCRPSKRATPRNWPLTSRLLIGSASRPGQPGPRQPGARAPNGRLALVVLSSLALGSRASFGIAASRPAAQRQSLVDRGPPSLQRERLARAPRSVTSQVSDRASDSSARLRTRPTAARSVGPGSNSTLATRPCSTLSSSSDEARPTTTWLRVSRMASNRTFRCGFSVVSCPPRSTHTSPSASLAIGQALRSSRPPRRSATGP